jgi:threonine synthase
MKRIVPYNVLGLQCILCARQVDFEFPIYRCPECGGNLEVVYDLAAISRKFRKPRLRALASRGHFAYQKLLPLATPGESHFSLLIGASQLVAAPGVAAETGVAELFLKDDTRLPSCSFKDRASSVVVAMAAERGLKQVSTASTGNAGCSMACLCANAGLDAVVFVPRTAPKAKIAQLLFFGAKVLQVEGTYDDAFDLCWEVCRRRGWLNRSTGWNPFTKEGKKTVSFEIAQQLDWKVPDLVFVPVGDGNIISGVWKGFRDLLGVGAIDRLPGIVAVQSTTSNAVSLAVGRGRAGTPLAECIRPVCATTRADSISVDLPRDGAAAVRAVLDSGGDVVEVEDAAILTAIADLSGRLGIFAEPAGAAAYAGFLQYARTHAGLAGKRVVCLVTGNGLKDVEAAASRLASPLVVPPDPDQAEARLGQ